MKVSENYHDEIKAYEYEKDPLKNLTLQDALILVAVCASEIDEEYRYNDAQRIIAMAHAHPLFQEKRKATAARVYHIWNLMVTKDRKKTVDLAVKPLSPELRETAFAWVTEMIISNTGLTEEKKSTLYEFIVKLSIERKSAERIINESLSCHRNRHKDDECKSRFVDAGRSRNQPGIKFECDNGRKLKPCETIQALHSLRSSLSVQCCRS